MQHTKRQATEACSAPTSPSVASVRSVSTTTTARSVSANSSPLLLSSSASSTERSRSTSYAAPSSSPLADSLVMGDFVRGRLNLAFRDLDAIPTVIAGRYAPDVVELDLTNNNFSNLSSLSAFVGLQTLILDHNQLTSHSKVPPLPKLRTLWVNHNQITNLTMFIEHVAAAVPGLKHISMLYNEACPNFFNGGTAKQYADYRLFVISRLKDLKVLDDQAVTVEERKESLIAYAAYKTSVVLDSTSAAAAIPRVMIKPRKNSSPPSSVRSMSVDANSVLESRKSPRPSMPYPAPRDFELNPSATELDAAILAEEQHRAAAIASAAVSPDSDWSSDEDIPEVYLSRASRMRATSGAVVSDPV